MDIPADQIERLRARCDEIAWSREGGVTFLFLRNLRLPAGASPTTVDGLLRLGDRGDGYATRLFFAKKVVGASKIALNWNADGIRILERNWYAYSWKAPLDIPVDAILLEHLKALM